MENYVVTQQQEQPSAVPQLDIRYVGQYPKDASHKQDYYCFAFGPGPDDVASIGVPVGHTAMIDWLRKCLGWRNNWADVEERTDD